MPLDADVAGPGKHRVRRQFGSVVADDHRRFAKFGDQIGQLAHDPPARNRRVHHRPEALARHVIDDVEDAEPSAGDQLVVHEVQAPALVGERQHRRGRPCANRAPSSLPARDCQPFLAVEPLDLLAVDRDAVPAQQDVQTPMAEPPALLRQLTQTRPQVAIICPTRTIPHARAIRSDNRACPPLAHPQRCLEMRDRLSLRGGRHHFFDSRSFNPALSSIVSASSRLSRAFSSSGDLRRFASDTARPPNFAFRAY